MDWHVLINMVLLAVALLTVALPHPFWLRHKGMLPRRGGGREVSWNQYWWWMVRLRPPERHPASGPKVTASGQPGRRAP